MAIMTGCAFAFFVGIALWRRDTTLYMFAGGVSIITACYMAEILNGGVTNNISITASLVTLGLGLVLIAYSFMLMFSERKEKES